MTDQAITDLAGASPQAIDTQLAAIYTKRLWPALQYAGDYRKRIRVIENGQGMPYEERDLPELRDRLAALDAKITAALDEIKPLDAEYLRRGWSRFFLVTNSNGHVHSSMECQTCFPTTQYAWLPELSGKSEDEAVKAHGAMMCTVCFPSAPVHPAYVADLAKREAEEQAKADAECPGSRTYDHDSSGTRYASPRARCNHCRQVVSLTSTGKMRAHKVRPRVTA